MTIDNVKVVEGADETLAAKTDPPAEMATPPALADDGPKVKIEPVVGSGEPATAGEGHGSHLARYEEAGAPPGTAVDAQAAAGADVVSQRRASRAILLDQ